MSSDRRIVLWGMMGVGKTTTGRTLAARIGLPFYDLDRRIENRSGLTIPDIFASSGETGFREIEHLELLEVMAQPGPYILALGGGTPLEERNRCALATGTFTVYLYCAPEVLVKRIGEARYRPLLSTLSETDRRDRILRLAEERDPVYRSANLTIEVLPDLAHLDRLESAARDYLSA